MSLVTSIHGSQNVRRIKLCLNAPRPPQHVPEFVDAGLRWMELEYVNGGTLNGVAQELEVSDIKEISKQLQQTLRDIHRLGPAHGDIRAPVILVRGAISPRKAVLINFSRAVFQSSAEDWGQAKRMDGAGFTCLQPYD